MSRHRQDGDRTSPARHSARRSSGNGLAGQQLMPPLAIRGPCRRVSSSGRSARRRSARVDHTLSIARRCRVESGRASRRHSPIRAREAEDIQSVIHLQGDSLERRMPTVPFDELADDVQNGVLHSRVERIVVGSRAPARSLGSHATSGRRRPISSIPSASGPPPAKLPLEGRQGRAKTATRGRAQILRGRKSGTKVRRCLCAVGSWPDDDSGPVS